jgi:hypothetical protein
LCGFSVEAETSAPPFNLRTKFPGKTYEVNTDCGNVTFGVGIIGETKQQTRLSNTGVTDEEKLEKVIVSISTVRQPEIGKLVNLFRGDGQTGDAAIL